MTAVALSAVFADFVSPRDPLIQDIASRLQPPGQDFLFGTDNFGRDVFSRVVHGARSSLYIAITSVSVGATLGTFIGVLSAYKGGWPDLVFQRVVDALLGFPFLVMAVIVVVALGTSPNAIILAVLVAFVPQVARLSRSRAVSVKEETFVLAARALGASQLHIVVRHILPNIAAPVLTYATGYVSAVLVAESALSFLGLGVPVPYPSWGSMLQEGRLYLEVAPWLTVFPGLALSITAFSFALMGDALRDALDPRSAIR